MDRKERHPRILCLDDQPANLRIREALLKQFGCEVTAVGDAQNCLRAATHQSFDLALLDYHLGGETTGADVAHDLRICAPGVVLVMLTGDPKIPESAKKSVDKVLIKGSSSPEDLFQLIEESLPDCVLNPRHHVTLDLFAKP